jgi:cation:H+ antiporter
MNSATFLMALFGLVMLIGGAEFLVRGASRLALTFGISPLVIGLTIVALGTSSPEMSISVQSALAGKSDIVIGNVVGSNIFNILLILGISAMIAPLAVAGKLVRFDVPIMIGASVLVFLMALDGTIGRFDGTLLMIGLLAYVGWTIWESKQETAAVQAEFEAEFGSAAARQESWIMNAVFVAGGLAALILGSGWFVEGAVEMARWLGISELIIGLTVVAAGTSLPEVATSVVAVLRGERDIAVGNAVGSNLFNILAVLGLGGLVAPAGLNISPAALAFDIPVMIAVAVACLPIFFTGHLIARWEGALFFFYYVAYTSYLIFAATEHALLPLYGNVMMLFVIPLTVLTLLVLSYRAWRSRHAQRPIID